MEKYREAVKFKIAILLLFCVALGAIPGVLAQFAEKTDYFGFIIGFAVGCELVVAFLIGHYPAVSGTNPE